MGSAYASLISFLIYNFLRFYYIKRLFNFQPFSMKNVHALLLGAVCFAAVWIIPFIANIYIDSVIKTSLFSILFALVFYRFKISGDINRAMEVYIDKFMLFTGLRKKDN